MLAFIGCIEGCLKAYLLKEFENHSNHMATLDFIVVVESDIFLVTYGGNMAKVIEGHRRWNMLDLLLLLMLPFCSKVVIFVVENDGKIGYLMFGIVDLKLG
ncbi:hypothetical protein Ddye_017595 [Dipteronia dyeriana]|uniref:O-fucosyltransferase family protein n=1 Tax=Dipteronia dyeriana TaxID=168575 RepID=A0AAD9U9H0_9ROSI|nr:hypothetical protein Ddye_017595 [Dipteronia dyeriana]